MTYPKANADEIRRYIYETATDNPILFSREDITKAENDLNITTKVGSTTAYQALLPQHVFSRDCFWNLPLPLGIRGVPLDRLKDSDECGIFLQTANRRSGKAYLEFLMSC